MEADKEAQHVIIFFDHVLPAGSKTQLKQTFTGNLTDDLIGFYRCKFEDSSGATKYLASSHMEPIGARRAFPCFDEPALKAEFTITLMADKDKTCLSNMDVASESEVFSTAIGAPRKAVKFNRSPMMSTYLVGFLVGDLNYIESNEFHVPIRVYATPDQNIEHARLALDIAVKSLTFYEKVFDSEFSLPKMDMVAVPDFLIGAMENWGLVTYRVACLLYDPKTASILDKKEVAELVTHELAHQWFGNLVTMDFWDGLWLKEGFATWMSWYCCNEYFPDWKVWETYVTNTLQAALSMDAIRSSHPVEVPIKRSADVHQIFDSISYDKGSCILGMVYNYVGEEKLLEGLRAYIKKHAYGNTVTGDLWAALASASGKPVDKVMDVWTKKVGFPVVHVRENPEQGTITLTQNRFLSTGDITPEDDETIYPVILNIRRRDGSIDSDTILDQRVTEIPMRDLDFFKINADHSCLYRTHYTPERLVKLGLAAKQGLLTVQDRAGIIADTAALAVSGQQPTSAYLELVSAFRDESSLAPWIEIVYSLSAVQTAWRLEGEDVKNALRAFRRDLVSPKTHELGWAINENEHYLVQEHKILMFRAAGSAGDETVISAAKEMLARFAAGEHEAIHPNFRTHVFAIAVRNGGEAEYNAVLNQYRVAPTSSEKDTALFNLGSTVDPALVQRTLAFSLSDEVRSQDISKPLGRLCLDTPTIKARWEWFKENYNVINKRLPSQLGKFGDVVAIVLDDMTTDELRKDATEFFKGKDVTGYERALQQSLEAIELQVGWARRDRDDVRNWLEQKGYLQ